MFPKSHLLDTIEAHLQPQVSLLPSAPVLCTLRLIPGLTISPTVDFPIHLAVMLAAAPALVMLSLVVLVSLVFAGSFAHGQ